MKVIITKSFEKDFLKILKYKTFLVDFSKLLKDKSYKFIDLKYPYKKFKYKISNISLRTILLCNLDNNIIPIFIAKKSNKKDWYNIILDQQFEFLLEKRLLNIKKDMKEWNIKIF